MVKRAKGKGIGAVEDRLTVIVLRIFVSTGTGYYERSYSKAYELKVYATGRSATNCDVKKDSASFCAH